ncbi:MAG: AAA family ATPase [bacterium]|nr:AAA family ATPase [bacterium]
MEDYLINTVSHEKSISDVLNLDPLVDSKMLALAFNPTFSRIVDMAGPEREFSFAARFLMKDFWRFVVRFQKTNLRKQILTRAFENFNKGPSTTSPNGAALGILDKEEPLPPEMKEAVLSLSIDQLTVKNFRGFTEKEFTFKKGFNLLLGDNGTGKTAMLDAVCVNLNGLLGCFDSPDEVNIIKPGDVHMTSHIYDGNIRLEPVYPAAIKTECAVMTKKISWEAARQNKKSYSNPLNPELKAIARQFRQAVQQGFHVTLPVIAYYGTGRLWLQKKSGPVEPLKPVSRFFGYQDCLDPQSNEKELARWMKLEELSQKQNRSNGRLYSAVKKTIVDSVTDFEEVWFDFAEDSIMLKLTNGQTLPVAHFSDGYRNMIAMIADIAFRMAILNPHLGPDVAQKTPGVVLIDEIDLHLHPKWQRSVVDDLKRTFPLVQFIATSHSPFIVQALRDSSEIINLDTENKFAGKLDLSIEDITEDIMGVHMPQQSKRYQEMTKVAEKYYKLLDEGKSSENDNQLKEIKHRLDELLIPYSDDPAFTTYLKMKRTAADLNETGK